MECGFHLETQVLVIDVRADEIGPHARQPHLQRGLHRAVGGDEIGKLVVVQQLHRALRFRQRRQHAGIGAGRALVFGVQRLLVVFRAEEAAILQAQRAVIGREKTLGIAAFGVDARVR